MGNSSRQPINSSGVTVHPHVHGELLFNKCRNCRNDGSSPRAWGTHNSPLNDCFDSRFIPTCMGNSSIVSIPADPVPVHPHVHGELLGVSVGQTNSFGSSPRAWGTLGRPGVYLCLCRFIPTCMGNSWTACNAFSIYSVHPHVHGELKSLLM